MTARHRADPRSRRQYAPGISEFRFDDFSGGLNLRDAPSQLAANESPDCMNVTLDERGGVTKRLGLVRVTTGGSLASPPLNLFYWATGGITIVQVGAIVYKTTDFVTFTLLHTFTTAARVAFTDFQYQLVTVHPVDGVWVSTGGAFTQTAGGTANMEAVKGTCIASWQNKCWVGGDPVNKSRLWFCEPGDPAKWTIASAWIDIREKDDLSITALGIGQGMDIAGRPGMLVFKDESTYRVNNSTSGAYTTLDSRIGAASPLAVTSLGGVTAAISRHGIYVTTGTSEMRNVSLQIEPMFTPTQTNFARLDQMCAGIYRDRIVFSLPTAGSTVNNRTLEFHPPTGWIVPHDFGVTAFTSYTKQDQKLHGAGPVDGHIWEVFKGGDDAGTAIAARYQTRWVEPGAGINCRYRRAMLTGRGVFKMNVKLNYTPATGASHDVTLAATRWQWGDGTLWGSTAWGPLNFENYQAFNSLGVGRAISLQFTHTGTDVAQGQAVLGGTQPEVGAFAVYGCLLDYIRLGYA